MKFNQVKIKYWEMEHCALLEYHFSKQLLCWGFANMFPSTLANAIEKRKGSDTSDTLTENMKTALVTMGVCCI